MMQTQKTQLPKQYWLYSNKRYVLIGRQLGNLPFVALEYERILKANGIPYRKVIKENLFREQQEVCEYWSPTFGLINEDVSLPLFAETSSFYKYCKKNHSQKFPTADTIEAAEETEKFVKKEIENYKQILREVSHYRFAKEQLSGEILKFCRYYNTPLERVYDINMNYEKFKILRVSSFHLTPWVVIFDLNKIYPNSSLTLEVPKDIAGAVIGRGGANIKNWAAELGVKRIQVIPK